MKTDARVIYTKRVLREALFDSLKTKSINHVRVKEICDKAGLNRATFYKHYRDCYDMIEQLQKELLDEFEQVFISNEKFGKKLSGDILTLLEKYSDLNEAAVNGKVADGLKNNMIMIARKYCIDEWRAAMPKASEEEVELLFTAVCAFLFQVAICESSMHDKEQTVNFVHLMLWECMKTYV